MKDGVSVFVHYAGDHTTVYHLAPFGLAEMIAFLRRFIGAVERLDSLYLAVDE